MTASCCSALANKPSPAIPVARIRSRGCSAALPRLARSGLLGQILGKGGMVLIDDLKALNSTPRPAFFASFLGWSLDAFDYFLLAFILKDIAADFHTSIAKVSQAIVLT